MRGKLLKEEGDGGKDDALGLFKGGQEEKF